MAPDPIPTPLRVAVGALLTPEEAAGLAAADPRIEVLYEPDLYPPQRFGSDLYGPADWRGTPDQVERFLALCGRAHALFGLPHDSPALLRRVAPANPDLFWVHTVEAGGGAKIRAARLAPEDLERLTVTTSAGVHARPLAEFALLGVLAGAKTLPRLQADQRAHLWGAKRPLGQVAGMTVVVVGMGGIGQQVAALLLGLGATVIGVNRTAKDVPGVEMHLTPDLPAVARRADALVNCLPGTPGTDNLIGADVLEATRPGCIVVSVGRGTCLDEAALIRLLASGHVGYAALDVTASEPLDPSSPLWDMPNVLISPHTASVTSDETPRTLALFLDNVARWYDGRPLRNVMNKELFY
ncbi:MAG: D-2-hydroxyacid dehydrogenase [Actinomycetia bacterium]|nr:D-2-hydroxyacid dehydrogenase [Actinomycetes bacterium]